MNLNTARALKTEMLAQATSRVVHHEVRALRARAARPLRVDVVQPVLAMGVSPIADRKSEYALAVRVYAGGDRQAARLLRSLPVKDKELDLVRGVRYTPRLTLRAGGSCGHFNITAGTLGGFVEDQENYYIMSNNHVLADSNHANHGDEILQPGPIDANSGHKVIGNLDKWLALSRTRTDQFDAALATFGSGVKDFFPWQYKGIGDTKKTAVANRFTVRNVVKRGRTTGVTHGRVSAFELNGVMIDYGTKKKPFVVTYDEQIEIVGSPEDVPFSDGGDSGSFIFDSDSLQPYALLYGGGPDDNGIDRTVAHFMPDVLKALKVQLVQ